MVANIREYSDNIASKVDHEIMVATSGRAIPAILTCSHHGGGQAMVVNGLKWL